MIIKGQDDHKGTEWSYRDRMVFEGQDGHQGAEWSVRDRMVSKEPNNY